MSDNHDDRSLITSDVSGERTKKDNCGICDRDAFASPLFFRPVTPFLRKMSQTILVSISHLCFFASSRWYSVGNLPLKK